MDALVIWAFFAIVQVHGGIGAGFADVTQCQEARAELMTHQDLVQISECLRFELKPVPKGSSTS